MTFNNSGLFVNSFIAAFSNTSYTGATKFDLTAAANMKIALMTDTETPNFDVATTTFSSTNACVDSLGQWPTAGMLLSVANNGAALSPVPGFTDTSGTLLYDMGDVSKAGTTITNAKGCIIYYDGFTGPAAQIDAMIVAVTFGQNYSTTNGTFTIQWSSSPSAVFTIDLTP